jgi:YesN/AraC family two-component response regulator
MLIRTTNPRGRPEKMIRVLLADDEALIRTGIRLVLETADDIEIVAEAATGSEAVDLVRRHRIDVALLDIRMPKLAYDLEAAADTRTRPNGPTSMS